MTHVSCSRRHPETGVMFIGWFSKWTGHWNDALWFDTMGNYLRHRTPESPHHCRKLPCPSLLYTSCPPGSCTPHQTPAANTCQSVSCQLPTTYGKVTFIDSNVCSTYLFIDGKGNRHGHKWKSVNGKLDFEITMALVPLIRSSCGIPVEI